MGVGQKSFVSGWYSGYSRTETMGRNHRYADDGDERDDEHLADVDDGCGCAEVWEHLSERRASD